MTKLFTAVVLASLLAPAFANATVTTIEKDGWTYTTHTGFDGNIYRNDLFTDDPNVSNKNRTYRLIYQLGRTAKPLSPFTELVGNDNDDILGSIAISSAVVYGMGGNDSIRTKSGADLVYGGLGKDSLDTGDNNDRAYGQDGDDTIVAGNGNDYIDGGRGNDTVTGGVGFDIFYHGLFFGHDRITDFDNTQDYIHIAKSDFTDPIKLSYNGADTVIIIGQDTIFIPGVHVLMSRIRIV